MDWITYLHLAQTFPLMKRRVSKDLTLGSWVILIVFLWRVCKGSAKLRMQARLTYDPTQLLMSSSKTVLDTNDFREVGFVKIVKFRLPQLRTDISDPF